MSEANSPENRPASSEASNRSNWYSDWDAFFSSPTQESPSPSSASPDAADSGAANRNAPPSGADPSESAVSGAAPSSSSSDWQTVNFPNAISTDAIERQSMYTDPQASTPPPSGVQPGSRKPAPRAAAKPSARPAAQPAAQQEPRSARTIGPNATQARDWAENVAEPQPDVPQLIALIQELNQCNHALLDRVSQLEEALELTQKTLREERQRSQVPTAETEDLTTARQQLAALFGELELSHQTNQRQQMLVETLTQQVSTQQERLAQLEQEFAIAQQRQQEQLQQLSQNESICRDLRVRLQRQQHYTLQFKAALERCLEAANPGGEASTSSVSAALDVLETAGEVRPLAERIPAAPLVPKVRHIQPWSAQNQPGVPPKLEGLRSQLEAAPVSPETDGLNTKLEDSDQIHPVNPFEVAMEAVLTGDRTAPETFVADPAQPTPSEAAIAPEVALAPEDLEQEQLLQSLARLIDVSAADVVQAIRAEDFSTFVSQPAAAAPLPIGEIPPLPPEPQSSTPPALDDLDSLKKLVSMPFETVEQRDRPSIHATPAEPAPAAPAGLEGLLPGTNFPAPVVYPLRTQKKRTSLAAVDLPTFPKN